MTLELYHADHSVCAQKVRLALAEKQLDWQGHLLDLMAGETHTPAYRRINPNEVVPALLHDGRIIVESTVINEYLDDAFPDPQLKPVDPRERAKMRLWTKQLDEGVHFATGVVSNGIALQPLRLRKRSREELLAEIERMPDPARRERQREALEKGLDSRFFKDAVRRVDRLLADMDAALSEASWLAGDSYSLADAGLTPYVTRFRNLRLMDATPARPRVMNWFERVRSRPSYETAIVKWWNRGKVEWMNEKGAEAAPKVRELLREV
jgi:glutathione S-transferase